MHPSFCTEFQIWVCRTVYCVLFCPCRQKSTKERHQRARRPLDTCFPYMGLFDRAYTRRGIRKALRQSQRRRFSHAPPNSTPSRCAAIVAVTASLPPQGKVCYPSNALPAGRNNGRVPRGRRSAVRAGFRVLATLRAIRLFRPSVGERVARVRMMDT